MYYLVYGFLYLCSLLPLPVLYLLSDFFYFVIYYVIGYRKQVVLDNITIAFPEKSVKERKRIAKDFYHKFIDSLVETIKVLSASDAFFEKRFTGNWQMINQYYDQHRSVQLHLGHTFNWEWGNIQVVRKIKHTFLGVYIPIHNKSINRVFKKLRSRSGAVLLDAGRMAREFLPYRKSMYCLGLIADQSPGRIDKAKWFTFFNRKTAFTAGPAKSAITNNAVVLFASIERVKRGYYHVTFTLAEENPKTNSNEDALTKKFVRFLEATIRQHPDMWLWSHRRWKHEWKEGDMDGDNGAQ
ncbi:lipid A biosynthesis acyltransferase [Niabella ginsenosidivorans]|uniref:Lipid A biosynthesis acyltransferase n=1 Tax=Niabella ginsenosidivorans TaxID=1176587 RepID=A0A1A9I5H0_9BACT|nr:lysophospholipid acyltransferase family protein [Niabella ginsenosidivorans]ANH82876.1 lipid A biosynthesis acyltransferase [Niabella ginsenosidivorans]